MSTTLWHDDPMVFAVDRDKAFCQTLRRVARGLGYRAEVHDSCDSVLEAVDPSVRGCVVADPHAPRRASEMLAKLTLHGVRLPVIIVSDRGEVPLVVEAMRAGALNYLQKPCETGAIASALQEAIAWDAQHARDLAEVARFQRRLAHLSSGERQVLEMLADGMTNQEVAAELRLSVRAIEVRRAKIRAKLRTKSLAELIRQLVADRSARPDRQPQPIG